MLKNLKAEMIKQDVSIQDIADVLKIKHETARKKLNGIISLSLKECQTIATLFKINNSLDYLFSN